MSGTKGVQGCQLEYQRKKGTASHLMSNASFLEAASDGWQVPALGLRGARG